MLAVVLIFRLKTSSYLQPLVHVDRCHACAPRYNLIGPAAPKKTLATRLQGEIPRWPSASYPQVMITDDKYIIIIGSPNLNQRSLDAARATPSWRSAPASRGACAARKASQPTATPRRTQAGEDGPAAVPPTAKSPASGEVVPVLRWLDVIAQVLRTHACIGRVGANCCSRHAFKATSPEIAESERVPSLTRDLPGGRCGRST